MREILFRGKRIDNGEWVEGYFYQGFGVIEKTKFSDWIIEPDGYVWEIVSETISQYTGHTDKNGNRIYEGDILSAHLDDESPEDVTYAKVTWDGFSWCTRETEEDEVIDEWACENYEVAGNIFDNPDLIMSQFKI